MAEAPEKDTLPWTGRWCWVRKHLPRPWNTYAFFRKTFDLPAKPTTALIRVSADSRYVLYVNARRIHAGPARSWPEFQSFDILDLADAFIPGRNVIVAIVHQFGVPTFQSVFRDAAGFLFDGWIDLGSDHISLSTPAGWLCRDARSWRKDVARLSIQLGFQEHFSAEPDSNDLFLADYNASEEAGWKPPVDLGPVGVHPWLNMSERSVPLLADHIERFQSIHGQFTGENARAYKVADDIYRLCAQESRKREKTLLENPDAMLRDDADMTIIPPPPDGQFSMAVLDLAQTRTGHLILDITEAAGDEIIDILYTEQADKNGPTLICGDKPTFCEEATADRYRCRPGPQRWEPFHMKGFRYASLVFRNLTRPLKLRHAAIRQVHAALEDIGSFECSDARLNQIWRVGRETLRNCMFDAYIDCPWREQAQWWGDARVHFSVNAYTFGDVSLLERGIRQMARSQKSDGSLHAHPPSDSPHHRLPDFMLTWIGTLWDHYFYTGRDNLLRETFSTLQSVLDFFARHENKDGLIGGFDGFWVFLDWQKLYKDDFSGVLNLMYLQALRWAAAICDVVGETACAETWSTKAATLAASVTKHFWDPKAKLWRDGYDPQRKAPIDSVSQHMHALAILLRLKPETHPTLAKEMLLKPAISRRTKTLGASPFFYAYILDALAEANFRADAIDIIRDRWGAMIDAGATTFWETWEPTIESRCHAWSASPVYHLSQQVLGVLPVDVGWRNIRIAPVPGKLDFAKGRVPSPLGVISVEWEKSADDQLAVRVDLPPLMQAEFIGPLGEVRMLSPGGHQFHT